MTHEYDFGIFTITAAVRPDVIVKKLLLGFDLLVESKRVSKVLESLAILSTFKTPEGMATDMKSRRIGRRRIGEQLVQTIQERLVVSNQAWIARYEIDQITLSLSVDGVYRRLVAYPVTFFKR